MLKLVRLYDIKVHDNVVKSVDAEILCDLPDDFDENAVLGLRDDFMDDESDIFVIWNIDNEYDLVSCEYVVFDNFVNCAEWDFRIYSAVAADALGMTFIM